MHTRFAALLLALGLADVGYLNLALGPDVLLVADDKHGTLEPSTERAALREGSRPARPRSVESPSTGAAPPSGAAEVAAPPEAEPATAPEPVLLFPQAVSSVGAADSAAAPDLGQAAAPADGALVVSFPETATAVLTAEARSELWALAERLRQHPEQHLRVIGHADARGPRGFNRYLGARRARAVAEVLLSAGVARRQIESLSRGEDDPRVVGEGEAAWAANRRVEIRVGSERSNTP